MSQERYIAAIEICSSKIIGAVGRYNTSTNRLDVIAVEQERIIECVCNGIIHNVEETANSISRILDKLESRTGVSPRVIRKVYVGLSGRSLRNIPREISRSLPEDTEITEDLIVSMADEARRSHIDASLEVLDAIPTGYLLNKIEIKSPIGNSGSNIKAKYQLIAARPTLAKHIRRVISDKVGIDIADIVITPIAVGNLILNSDERRLGCMLVDMGAETITVSIYQKGVLDYLAVLPMGSRNITRDISSLSILEEDAEKMKSNSGKAIASDDVANFNINGVRLSDVSNLVVARSEELVANIIEQITYAGLTNKQLSGGIITVGGGFNLNQMGELLRQKSDLKVRRGSLPENVMLEDTKAPSYETIEVIAIMNAGTAKDATDCLELPKNELPEVDNSDYWEPETPGGEETNKPVKKPKRPNRLATRGNKFLTAISAGLAGIFSREEDDDDEPEIN
ncbi:MAG: cell division protein FtsA [Prevotella sp.]|nr:cell division protein FtsA [Prevotella sp.]MCM1075053.1 cell division protein FtsA [Ruminococcus sp.]